MREKYLKLEGFFLHFLLITLDVYVLNMLFSMVFSKLHSTGYL